MKTIVLNPAAAKSFDKLPENIRKQISAALHAYVMHGTGDTKAMTGAPAVRMRSGDYRIIFDESALSVTVLALGHQRDIYR